MRVSFSFFCIFLLGLKSNSFAQDLSSIDKKNPIKVSGGITANTTAYTASGINNRRDPFFWMLSGNLNIDILGVFIPLSATVSQQQTSYSQPFNQFGLSPRYKAVTAHLGYRTMQFSNFTLGGNLWLGAGVEINPAKSLVKGAAMFGRLARAVDERRTDGFVSGEPSFERWGYGSKISVGNFSHNVDFIFFRGKDRAGSVSERMADSFNLKPTENFVVGIVTKQTITQQLTFDLEYSLSAYNTDIRAEEVELEKYRYANNLGFLFTPTLSSQFNRAILGNLTYATSLYQLRLSYRRIDPEFKTMGSTFLNNDIEDIAGNVSWRMFENKVNISTGLGVQRNNLDKSLHSGMKRLIGSLNVSYMLSKKLNLGFNYSNFTSNTKINNQFVNPNQIGIGINNNLDSLNYNQVTNSAGGTANYNTGNERIKHTAFFSANYQKANDSENNSSTFYNVNSGYQINLVPSDIFIAPSINYNNTSIKTIQTFSIGPNLALTKLLFNKALRTGLSVSLLNSYTNENFTGRNTIIRFGNSYRKGKHHTVSMDLTYLKRAVSRGSGTPFSELRGSLLYSYTF